MRSQRSTSSSCSCRAAAARSAASASAGPGWAASAPGLEVDRVGEVHRRRPGRAQGRGRPGDLVLDRRQAGAGRPLGGEGDAHGAGHADRRGAAHDHVADRVDHLGPLGERDGDGLAGQRPLVEHLHDAVAEAQDVVRGEPGWRLRRPGRHVPLSQEAR